MTRLKLILESLIWPAVVSAFFGALAVLTALIAPDKGTLALALGLSAIAWAGLAQTV